MHSITDTLVTLGWAYTSLEVMSVYSIRRVMSVVKRSGFPLEGSGLFAQGPSAKGPLSLETGSQLNGLARRGSK